MAFLRMLESIRNPVLDAFFSRLTLLGNVSASVLAGMVLFWCVNKQLGRYVLSVSIGGTVLSQWLKLIFRVPRPWVREPSFTIVESARDGAAGYSFPSGHAQAAVGLGGCIARWSRNRRMRCAAIVLAVLVSFSRMYLGVHFPSDVLVAASGSILLVLVLYPLMTAPGKTRGALAGMTVFSLAYLIYALCQQEAGLEGEALENLHHGIGNAWTLLGCAAGLWASFELDERWIRFDTHAVWWAQILKVLLGAGLVLGVRAALKSPLNALFAGGGGANLVRYFLMTLTAGALWPLSFRRFARLGKHQEEQA